MCSVTNSDRAFVRVPSAIRAAADAYCEAHGVALSTLMLHGLCKEIGQPELIEEIRGRGRQKSEPKKKPARRK